MSRTKWPSRLRRYVCLVFLSINVICWFNLIYSDDYTAENKCIGDDTKAAARQSLKCIKNKNKIKYGENDF